ncbi:MAG TPA: hypothetical protein VMW08_00905 [Acidimicrobiales bacterium]|nr:hypothetical protein [Acidimicrobiales bacterium]
MSGQLPDADEARRQVLNEVALEDGTVLVKGDEIHAQGEPGATFKFIHLAISPDGSSRWVSCYGGTKGRGMHRALRPEKIRVKKGTKAVKIGDPTGEAAEEFVAEAPPEEEAPVTETVEAPPEVAPEAPPEAPPAEPADEPEVEELKGEDFEEAVKPKRRPDKAAKEGALAEAIAAGRIKAGTELHHGEYRGVVTASGHVEVAGETYNSPSTAAKNAAGRQSANGWDWWKLPSGEKLQTVR